MKKLFTIAVAILGSTFAATAQNAGSTATQTTNLNLNNAIEMTFLNSNSATGNAVNLNFSTVNDYANGVASNAQDIRVRSNKRFNVSVKANTSTFTYTGSTTPAPTMPVWGTLGLMVSANNTGGTIAWPFSDDYYLGFTTSAWTLISNGTNGGNQTFAVKYKAAPGFTYPAGTYTVDVVYTATQQ